MCGDWPFGKPASPQQHSSASSELCFLGLISSVGWHLWVLTVRCRSVIRGCPWFGGTLVSEQLPCSRASLVHPSGGWPLLSWLSSLHLHTEEIQASCVIIQCFVLVSSFPLTSALSEAQAQLPAWFSKAKIFSNGSKLLLDPLCRPGLYWLDHRSIRWKGSLEVILLPEG